MNKLLLTATTLLLFSSCVEEKISSQQDVDGLPHSLNSLLKTKSAPISETDSLKILSKLQSSIDNLMLGRVLMKDSVYILAIKKEDALFLGVSEDVYNQYLEYVDNLNSS